MELLNSPRRGKLLFQNSMIYSFYHHKSHGKFKDKEHLNLKCLVQVGPGPRLMTDTQHSTLNVFEWGYPECES